MSTAGLQRKDDPRNRLILSLIKAKGIEHIEVKGHYKITWNTLAEKRKYYIVDIL